MFVLSWLACSFTFLIQINKKIDTVVRGFLFGLPVHGYLPGAGQPKQVLHLLGHHWLLSTYTADFIDVTLASRDGQPASTHKVVFSRSDSSSKLSQTNAPLVFELPTLPSPSPALATPASASPGTALTTSLPQSKGQPQPARAVKTNPLICTHCGLLKRGHPGPTGDRCLVPKTHNHG